MQITNTSFTSVTGSLYADIFQALLKTSSWLFGNSNKEGGKMYAKKNLIVIDAKIMLNLLHTIHNKLLFFFLSTCNINRQVITSPITYVLLQRLLFLSITSFDSPLKSICNSANQNPLLFQKEEILKDMYSKIK